MRISRWHCSGSCRKKDIRLITSFCSDCAAHPDRAIIDRLNSEELILLTNDHEFLHRSVSRSRVIVSRVTQSQPIAVRVEIWLNALREYFSRDWPETQFEVFDDGKLRPWQPQG